VFCAHSANAHTGPEKGGRFQDGGNEATARIRINKLLEAAGWRFFPEGDAPANILLESCVALKACDLEALGDDFEKSGRGFVDFLLLDSKGRPFIVLEAKSEGKNPLAGKEQARKYARSRNCRFVLLSNGNLHYFWDLERGNPAVVTAFPTPESATACEKFVPDPDRLVKEPIEDDYIVLTQRPGYKREAAWRNDAERPGFIESNKLRFLRPYQLAALRRLQDAVREGNDRFLFEMATGTGKTLTAAAVVKLFLRTGNARRVLFLVDRLELEGQAKTTLGALLSNDFTTVVYKENRDDWRRAEIVVTTVQSLLFNNRYQRLFSPTDFDLVISDRRARSIGRQRSRRVRLLHGIQTRPDGRRPATTSKTSTRRKMAGNDPRGYERRILLDTYRSVGCENGAPTFRYSLLDGVGDRLPE
jgi:type I restriction enzyme R subunit